MRLVDGALPYKGSRRKLRAIRLRGNWSFTVVLLLVFIAALLLVQLLRWFRAA